MVSANDRFGAFFRSSRRLPQKNSLGRRPDRNARLVKYTLQAKEAESLFPMNKSKALEIFMRTRESFFAEGWTVNHFHSVESKALLLDTVDIFRRLSEKLGVENRGGRPAAPKPGLSPSLMPANSHHATRSFQYKAKTARKKIEVFLIILAIILSAVLMFVFT